MTRKVYLDYAATTPLCKAAFSAMEPYFSDIFGNADSLHGFGSKAALGLDTARREIAAHLNAGHDEIYFTSGGTESNNWALRGAAGACLNSAAAPHIIVSAVEHASVLQTAGQLKQEGFCVTELPVNIDGAVDPAQLETAITRETRLISVMLANNEIGTVQPIKALAAVAKKHRIPFHTDAVQAAGTLKLDVKELGVDLLTISAHKFYGPKGVGVLYVDQSFKPHFKPLIAGGQQEREMRGGTSNVAGAVGMAAALKAAAANMDADFAHVKGLRDGFVDRIESEIPFVRYNGARENRLPQNANFSFGGLTAGELIHALDLAGVACASGSACSSGSVEPSHVLAALGVGDDDAKSAVRFSFSRLTTPDEMDFAVKQIKKTVEKLRGITTLFAHKKSKTERV